MIELRLRTRLRKEDLEPKIGKVLGPRDYDALLTGPARVTKPDGRPLCVYLPAALTRYTQNREIYGILHSLRDIRSQNRGLASGTDRVPNAAATRTYAADTPSMVVGAVDPMGQTRYCRLTVWTGKNLPRWRRLQPLLSAIGEQLAEHVPDRYAIQADYAARTVEDWVVPGTPFTTVTVNNTYSTGMHTDKGDLEAGFSTITCLRRGSYTGGQLMFPEYRVAVDLKDGDLLLMDAHEWHANAAIICACGSRLFGPCESCPAERISVVAYYRTKMAECGTAEDEADRAVRVREKVER